MLLLDELCLQNEFLILSLSRHEAKAELHICSKIPSNAQRAAAVSEINLVVRSSCLPLNWENPEPTESVSGGCLPFPGTEAIGTRSQ